MIPIPVKEFVKQTVKANPTEDAASLTAACHEMLQLSGKGNTAQLQNHKKYDIIVTWTDK